MSPTLLLIAGALYIGVAFGYYQASRYGMCVAFLSYALANFGFAMDAW